MPARKPKMKPGHNAQMGKMPMAKERMEGMMTNRDQPLPPKAPPIKKARAKKSSRSGY